MVLKNKKNVYMFINNGKKEVMSKKRFCQIQSSKRSVAKIII